MTLKKARQRVLELRRKSDDPKQAIRHEKREQRAASATTYEVVTEEFMSARTGWSDG